jgi:diguanylate cyclase (GGDEF)-like protein
MNSEKIAHKISFAKLYKPYDWIVASGVYLDDLDQLIAEETAKMQKTHNQQKRHSLAITLLTILSAIAIMVFFEKRIRYLIVSYEAQIKSHTNRLELLSTIDSLTGLYNRFKLDNVFTYELNKARRYKKRFSIIIADLDNFKQVNDNYGHQIGDKVIQELATVLTNNARCTDTVGRWGGEEFLIICPDTDLQGAKRFAEKVRQAVKQHHFPVIHDLTCSFGVTSFNVQDTQQSMMQRADQALYYAKENGRNRVITADL